MIYPDSPDDFDFDSEHDANLVLVSLPMFFQRNASELEARFHCIGPLYNSGASFRRWDGKCKSKNQILVSATTGLLPQVEYFATAVRAFSDMPFNVVLSIGDELDPESLPFLPDNFEINQHSSQQEILKSCCLFVCHSGTSSIFEALKLGVPLIVAPPSQVHDIYATRVAELGLGVRLAGCEFTAENLRKAATAVVDDAAVLQRVREAQREILSFDGAERGADILETYIANGRINQPALSS